MKPVQYVIYSALIAILIIIFSSLNINFFNDPYKLPLLTIPFIAILIVIAVVTTNSISDSSILVLTFISIILLIPIYDSEIKIDSLDDLKEYENLYFDDDVVKQTKLNYITPNRTTEGIIDSIFDRSGNFQKVEIYGGFVSEYNDRNILIEHYDSKSKVIKTELSPKYPKDDVLETVDSEITLRTAVLFNKKWFKIVLFVFFVMFLLFSKESTQSRINSRFIIIFNMLTVFIIWYFFKDLLVIDYIFYIFSLNIFVTFLVSKHNTKSIFWLTCISIIQGLAIPYINAYLIIPFLLTSISLGLFYPKNNN